MSLPPVPPPLPVRDRLYYVLQGAVSGSGIRACRCPLADVPGDDECDEDEDTIRVPPPGTVVRVLVSRVDSDGDAYVAWIDEATGRLGRGFVLWMYLHSVEEVEREIEDARRSLGLA